MAAASPLEGMNKRITELENMMLLVIARLDIKADSAALTSSATASSAVAVAGGASHQIPNGCGVNHNTSKMRDRLTVHYHLYFACSAGCHACVQALLDANQYGFDINQGSHNEGFSAMDYAVWGQKKKHSVAGNYDAVIQLLISRGAVRKRTDV